MTDSLNMLTLNAQGLNCPTKRASLLDVLDNHNIQIALLSETHFLRGSTPRLEDKRFKILAQSSANSKTKGVLILARRNLALTVLGTGGDLEGRICFVKTMVGKKR